MPPSHALSGIDRDGRIVIAARALRAFAQGFASVLLAIYLAGKGLGLPALGLFFSAGVLGGAVQAIALGSVIARFGRKRVLIGLTLLAAGFSFALTFSDALPWLLFFAFAGSLAGVGGAGGAGPAQPVEQAILADATGDARRAHAFALYRFIATVATALGGLAAALPALLESQMAMSAQDAQGVMIRAWSICLVGVALCYGLLSREVDGEADGAAATFVNPLRTPSRRLILGLNGLFSIDQLASSLTTASLVAYWFQEQFGVGLATLAAMSFAAQALSAVSMWGSVRLSERIGFIRTMVFTHIPASAILVAIPFAPDAQLAIGLWLTRAALAQMDIPARDALTMSVVGPDERVAMASVHLVARNSVGTVGPALSTAMWQTLSAAAPLVACGLLKITYDVALYAFYRDVERKRALDSPDGRD